MAGKTKADAERAVAFRWLAESIREAELELEHLGLPPKSWHAVGVDFDALERRSPRLVLTVQYRSETNDRTGQTSEWRGNELTALLGSRRPADRVRQRRAQAAALQARSAHTALLLCEQFNSLMADLRREASANAARGKRSATAIKLIVEEGRRLVVNQGLNVSRAAHLLAPRRDIRAAGLEAKGSPYKPSGIREMLRDHGIRRLPNSATSGRRK